MPYPATPLQDLENQVRGQKEGMEELAGRTQQLVVENEEVCSRPG